MVEASDLALLFNNEVANVLAALRAWAAASTRFSDDEVALSLLEDLEQLRRRIFSWKDLGDVEVLRLLSPFFEVIRSPETGGPLTGTALGTMRRLVLAGFFELFEEGVAEAVNATAEAVTSCRFEATMPSADECVLFRILEVLGALVTSPCGALLSHDALLNVLQAAYRIGHYQTEKGRATSDMLAHASRDALSAMIAAVFARLSADVQAHEEAPPRGEEARAADEVSLSPTHHLVVGDSPLAMHAARRSAEVARESAEAEVNDAPAPLGEHEALPSIVSLVEAAPAPEPAPAPVPAAPSVASSREAPGAPAPCGLDTAREILSFVISLIATVPGSGSGSLALSPGAGKQDLSLQGLHLLLVVLETGGVELLSRPELAGLLAGRLPRALFDAGANAPPTRLSALCSVALSLYVRLRGWAIVQVEALVRLLLLPLAEGRAGSAERQRIALECLLDFCRQPSFACDVYLAADCRVERADLLQEICAALSKTAQPAGAPDAGRAAAQGLALDVLLALLCSLDALGEAVLAREPAAGEDADALELLEVPSVYVDIWTPLAAGLAPPTDQFLRRRDADEGEESLHVRKGAEGETTTPLSDGAAPQTHGASGARGVPASATHGRPADRARAEKRLKSLLASAAEHYNLDAKKGLQFAQSTRLLPRTLDAVTLGRYLRCCPGLNEAAVGEALGERDAFSADVRAAYVATFDFAELEFDVALRLFLDAFRLPGEGQKIDRIMESFGRAYHAAVPGSGLRSPDAAYVLAFSVIMLNTDLHKQRNDRQPRMTLEGFKRINDSTNDGEPMPAALLEHLYAAISRDRLTITADAESTHELPSVYWTKLAADAARASDRLREELARAGGGGYEVEDAKAETGDAARATAPVAAQQTTTTLKSLTTTQPARPQLSASSSRSRLRHSGSFAVLDGHEGDGARGHAPRDPGASIPIAALYVTAAVVCDIYALVCTPALAAAEATLEAGAGPAPAPRAVACALDALRLVSRGAARHGVSDALDAAVAALSSAATGGLHASRHGVAAWAAADAGRGALRALGEVLATHGDQVRAPGWRAFAAALQRLHRAGLLPPAVLAADADDLAAAAERVPAPREAERADGGGSSATSLLSRALNSLISVDGGAGGPGGEREREAALLRAAAEAVDAADLPGILAETKFLVADALVELLQALAFAAGDFAGLLSTGEPTDGAELCLELLFTVALRNRDRIAVIWPLLHEVIAAAVSASAEPNAVVRRATLGLLRVCERLLPSQQGADAALMRTLTLVLGLSPAVALQLAADISSELLNLLRSAAPFIETEADWKTICSIIRLTSVHPEAAPAAFECLRVAAHDPRALTRASAPPLLETCQQLAERYRTHAGGELAIGFLSMEEHVLSWIVRDQGGEDEARGALAEAEVSSAAAPPSATPFAVRRRDMWWGALSLLASGVARDADLPALRDAKLLAMQRCLLASTEAAFVDAETWARVLENLVLPVVENLTGQAASGPRQGRPAAARSLRLAAGLLVKVLLAALGPLRASGRFAVLWPASLGALGACMGVQDDAVRDSVPENVKNLLLVLATSGVLVPGWTEGGVDLWQLTWSKAQTVSSGLNPNLLVSAGLAPKKEEPKSDQAGEQSAVDEGSLPREAAGRTEAVANLAPAGESGADDKAVEEASANKDASTNKTATDAAAPKASPLDNPDTQSEQRQPSLEESLPPGEAMTSPEEADEEDEQVAAESASGCQQS